MSTLAGIRRALIPVAALMLTVVAVVAPATSGAAHGFSTVVYVDASASGIDGVRTEIGLEYDLLVATVAKSEDAPQFFEDGMEAFRSGDEASALNAHADAIVGYVSDRFDVSADGRVCEPERVGALDVIERQGVPYALLTLDFACAAATSHEFRSTLFPDEEGFVRAAVTIVEYDLDGRTSTATLNREAPGFDTEQPLLERFSQYFVLGAEHLLYGIDHLLFLLALIVGSRRLRDVVLAATAFTVAHSVTFTFAALGIISVPATIVEPVIALSIAVVASWYLWRARRDRAAPLVVPPGKSSLDAADWARLAVVFGFGLMHGLGFAGALGIDEPFSWPLLWSLLVFNLGIEAVQVGIIVVLFPLLMLWRRQAPTSSSVGGAVVAAGVAVTGLVWFVQRVLGIG
ncbi:aromatic ring-opening dioxygenase LigA [Agromyces sp. Root81]|uniref:HupE/UreJ family protein n=1 Tax=Agromyces sp. Root81 TaxID=1736601 RepID=UPI0006F9051D|nr:HupE/UreJ family protein [Agromyces sp. Root81]KRC62514.1 aromatic ring-opening dioxygenase LigA [Agromyces sp. Root81]